MLPDVQLSLRPGIIEFGWGHPDMALLPVSEIAQAIESALGQAGPDALSYGAEQGPGRLIEQLHYWLQRCEKSAAAWEGRASPAEQLFITGGVSQALDLLCMLLTRPGDTVLVESPTYHLALRIFRDHGLQLVPVPGDDQGLLTDALEATLDALRRQGHTPRFLYTVPTFGNPTGRCLAPSRRTSLVAIAHRAGLTVLEDDVYHQLWFDAPPPPSLYSLAPCGPVIRLCSFSKILAPGLRLGWLQAAPEVVQRCVRSGLLDSGGGINHLTAHVVAALMAQGLLDVHVARLRAGYRQRCHALLEALARFLPGDSSWTAPGGGFFVWVRLPEGYDSTALLPIAEAAGVAYIPGNRFFAGRGGERYMRLAFSLLPIAELEEGARRLGAILYRR